MDVTFRATPDLGLVTEAVVEVNRYPLRVLRAVGLVVTVVFAVLGVFGPELFGFSGAAVTLLLSLGVPAWFLRQAASSAAHFICVETEYTFGPAGVSTSTEHRDTTTRWPLIKHVVETPELIVLRLVRGGGLLVVPIAGLDDEARAQVLGFARSLPSDTATGSGLRDRPVS